MLPGLASLPKGHGDTDFGYASWGDWYLANCCNMLVNTGLVIRDVLPCYAVHVLDSVRDDLVS